MGASRTPRLWSAPGHDPRTALDVAALDGCKATRAFERLAKGLPLAGAVWTALPPQPKPKRKPRAPALLTAEGDPTPRTYAELSKMAGFKNARTVYVQVSQRRPICGRVYTPVKKTERGAGGGRPPIAVDWHKPAPVLPSPAPSAEPRRWVSAYESDVQAVNAMRILPRLDSGAAKVAGGGM